MQHEYKCDQYDQYHNQNWCLERGRKEQEKQINKYKTLYGYWGSAKMIIQK